jgi:hypothetical protein
MASDSVASIVVWFATPTRTRSRSGSKPGWPCREVLRGTRRGRARRALLDVVHHELRLVHVADDDVLAARVRVRLARRGARLLVEVLAVDQRREAVARVRLDALPHVQHEPHVVSTRMQPISFSRWKSSS